jgi:sugar/nucleoside kinase (ribokinase family)
LDAGPEGSEVPWRRDSRPGRSGGTTTRWRRLERRGEPRRAEAQVNPGRRRDRRRHLRPGASRQFERLGVDTSRLVVQRENFDTVAFGKPYLDEREEPRVDFGFFNKRSTATDAALLEGIRDALRTADAMIVNQQVPGSITNESFIEGANALFAACPNKPILLDSRHFGDRFQHIIRKINDREAARLNGVQVARDENPSLDDVKRYALNLYGWFNKPVFLTRGAKGMLAIDERRRAPDPRHSTAQEARPGRRGRHGTSALALCLGAGVPPAEAAEFANFAAAVTVQKLFQTGTADGDEIQAVAKDPDFIYQPELGREPAEGEVPAGTEIETTGRVPATGHGSRVTSHHCDSPRGLRQRRTISTLRQGWEEIMGPVMIKAILGDRYATRRRVALPEGSRAGVGFHRQVHRHPYHRADGGPGSAWSASSASCRRTRSSTASATSGSTTTR